MQSASLYRSVPLKRKGNKLFRNAKSEVGIKHGTNIS